jgi:hypothetical protein
MTETEIRDQAVGIGGAAEETLMAVDLDQGGFAFQKQNTYLGPTLGWLPLRVKPERYITGGGSYTLSPDDGVVLVNVPAAVTLTLPNVAQWMNESFGQPLTAFERTIWVKDIGGYAGSFPITVNAFTGQKIDTASSATINTFFGVLRLYPLADQSGWFIG